MKKIKKIKNNGEKKRVIYVCDNCIYDSVEDLLDEGEENLLVEVFQKISEGHIALHPTLTLDGKKVKDNDGIK